MTATIFAEAPAIEPVILTEAKDQFSRSNMSRKNLAHLLMEEM